VPKHRGFAAVHALVERDRVHDAISAVHYVLDACDPGRDCVGRERCFVTEFGLKFAGGPARGQAYARLPNDARPVSVGEDSAHVGHNLAQHGVGESQPSD
jgi:hypothetical protein